MKSIIAINKRKRSLQVWWVHCSKQASGSKNGYKNHASWAGEMALWVEHLLSKHEDWVQIPRAHMKSRAWRIHACNPNTGRWVEMGGNLCPQSHWLASNWNHSTRDPISKIKTQSSRKNTSSLYGGVYVHMWTQIHTETLRLTHKHTYMHAPPTCAIIFQDPFRC